MPDRRPRPEGCREPSSPRTARRPATNGRSRRAPGAPPTSRRSTSPPKRTDPADGAVNPVTTSSSVVLPAPFGPIRPTTSPGSTAKLISSSATTPPNRTVMSATSSRAGSPPPSRRLRGAGVDGPRELERLGEAMQGAGVERGDPVGRPPEHRHRAQPGEDREPRDDVGALGNQVGEDLAPERARGTERADDARDPGDAADHGVLDEQDRTDDAVLAEPDVRLSQGQQDAAGGRDPRRHREGVELDADDADAERRGGPLVAADRQQSGTDPASTEVGRPSVRR